MTGGLNKVMIIGSLGRDAEMRYTPTGRPIASFSVVVERKGAQAEGAVDWFTVVAWDSLAEACNEQLEQGKLVYVEGRLQTRGFQKGGQKHYRSEVAAEVVIPLEDASPSTDEDQEEELPAAADEISEESTTEGEGMETGSTVESQGEPMEDEEAAFPPEEGSTEAGEDPTDDSSI